MSKPRAAVTLDFGVCVFGLALLVAGLAACGPGRPSPLRIVNPTCDNLSEASGASVDRPVFGWELESAERAQVQSASQIRIATSPDILETDRPDVWDSGKRRGRSSAFVPCGGKRLEPGREYFWKVRVWDGKGRPSAWSAAARFVTELVSPEEWSGARWIALEELPDPLKVVPGVHGNGDELGDRGLRRPVVPLFRKEFDVGPEGVKNALVFVSGLGQFELRVNGRKVGDGFLQPGWTDYRKTCLYDTFDVTGLLKPGRNVIGLVVGNGFFNVDRERYRKLVIAYGMPMMIAKVDIESASGRRSAVVSGPDWKAAPSPIAFTSIYGGEDFDARLEQPGWDAPGFDDSTWRPALAVAGPGGRLSPERDVPLRVMEEIPFKAVAEPRPGVFVYDFGQNASGIVALKVRGRKGQTVTIAPAELLDAKGLADQSMSGSPYRWTYTLTGGGAEEWTPRFTYYGFRYVQVEGAVPASRSAAPASALPEIIGLRMLHTRNSAPTAGRFSCSKDLFNRTFTLIDWAIRSNLASVPTDCPHREKLGWLEQTHLMAGSIHDNYRALTLYQKLVRDMIEAQLSDGLVPDIAPEYVPFVGGFRDSPEWGSAAVVLPWFLHEWYGDTGTMTVAYPMMKRYVDYLASKAKDHILSHGLGDWYDLGPKPPGEAQLTPRALTATAIYYRDLDLLARMARLLGKDADAKDLAARAETVKEAFNGKFFDAAAKAYATGSQTSYAMPLYFGMVPPADRRAVFANLVRSIREGGGALTAGDVGYDYLLKALEEGGASDLIFAMNDRADVPGYGYQLAHGATALTESWAARRDVSNNHMMLGHLMEWFYSGLAGIRQAEGSSGFEALEIAPHPVGDVTWVRAEYRSIKGRIVSSWRLEGGKFLLDVEVPPNATATVLMPVPGPSGGSGYPDGITESGLALKRAKGLKFRGFRDGRAVLEVGSGAYHFACPAPTSR